MTRFVGITGCGDELTCMAADVSEAVEVFDRWAGELGDHVEEVQQFDEAI